MTAPGFVCSPELQARLDAAEQERGLWRQRALAHAWDEVEIDTILHFARCSMGVITEIEPGWITIKRRGCEPARWWRFTSVPMIEMDTLPPLMPEEPAAPKAPAPRKDPARPAATKTPAAPATKTKVEPKQRALF